MSSITEQQAKDFIHNNKNPNESYGCWVFNTVNEPLKEDMFGVLAHDGEISISKRIDTFYVFNPEKFFAALEAHKDDNDYTDKLYVDIHRYEGSPAKTLYFTYDFIKDTWLEIEDEIGDLEYTLNQYKEELDYIRRIM